MIQGIFDRTILSTADVARQYPVQYLRYNVGIEKILQICAKVPQDRKVRAELHYGHTRTGKTMKVKFVT